MRLPLSPTQTRIARALAARPREESPPARPDHWAAVAVILAPDPDSVLLIRRAERADDPWSGHMGLPGGRRGRADADLLETALRETVEEVGCTLRRPGLLGTLEDVWPRSPLPRLIVVRPFVFAVPERPPLFPGEEVAETHWVSLAELRRQDTYRDTVIHLHGEDRVFPAYHVGPGLVWGLTERILTPLLELA